MKVMGQPDCRSAPTQPPLREQVGGSGRRVWQGLMLLLVWLAFNVAPLSLANADTDVDVFGLPHSPASSGAGGASMASASTSTPPMPLGLSAAASPGTSTERDDGTVAQPRLRLPASLRVLLSAGIVLQGQLNARIDEAAKQLRTGSSPGLWWTLLAMSFAYGVLHAVGPGHGKLMVGAYLGSRNARMVQAIGLSVWTATVQALAAIVLVFAAFWLSRDGLVHVLSRAATLEVVGYGLLCLAGAWTLWSTVTRRDCCVDPSAIRLLPNRRRWGSVFTARRQGAASIDPSDDRQSDGDYLGARLATGAKRGVTRSTRQSTTRGMGRARRSAASVEADAARRTGNVDAKRIRVSAAGAAAASTVSQLIVVGLAAGIRPCVGAIFVLVASVTAGIPGVGVASAFAMSAGVAITVSIIAVGGVGINRVGVARGLRYRMQIRRAQRACAVFGAIVILLYGATQIALLSSGYLTPSIT